MDKQQGTPKSKRVHTSRHPETGAFVFVKENGGKDIPHPGEKILTPDGRELEMVRAVWEKDSSEPGGSVFIYFLNEDGEEKFIALRNLEWDAEDAARVLYEAERDE